MHTASRSLAIFINQKI